MHEKTYTYGRQVLGEDDIQAVVDVLRSDRITQGPRIMEFEQRLCERLGAPHCTVTSSGTASLHLTALGLGWKSGDIVITSPITFVASANCILYTGATPDFADIDPLHYTLDPARLEERIRYHESAGRKVRGIVAVDYAGHPCDWEALAALAKTHQCDLVNDHCHAFGASYKNDAHFAARYADAVILSFHPVKHITTGEGGAVVTRHERLDRRIKLLRTHGIMKAPRQLALTEGPWSYEMIDLGFNYRITDIQCALGISQLGKLDRFLLERRAVAAFYDEAFAGDDRFVVPAVSGNSRHAYHLYPLQIDFGGLRISKAELFGRLREERIECQVHYKPVHLQPYYMKLLGTKAGDYPVAEEFYRRTLSIPIHPGLTRDDTSYVSHAIKHVVEKMTKR
ncbi:MAG TPA: UDP-4-amino-4,6-dideoxy-N-acetyl-beta-L-altrosamine transaminase [Bacteroidota bacterium]|nr:UDP-4-amino-4,6-dideoxy-N-acetyl-beta-L-altrosamine transaminase [Bacteroidota bacterium]